MTGIYIIINPKGLAYIGQSININKRISYYKRLNKQLKGQTKLYNSLIKYGVDNHYFNIICECKESELNKKERYYQEYYDVLNNGLNCVLTKTKDKSGKMSEETKGKISKALKGVVRSDEYLLNLSKRQKGVKKSKSHIDSLILNSGQKKGVICLDNGVFFNSSREAAECFGINKNTLRGKLNGTRTNNTNLIYI
jgi:group I intron endonuclease